MNTETEVQQEFSAPAVIEDAMSAMAVMSDDKQMERMIKFAEVMSTAGVTVPAHFRGKPGDCLAVIMQSMQWGMNPFAVAQKTHLVNGNLGYEAQLVNAVVQATKAIAGRFHYEYRGEGANIECRVGATIRGESEITWGEFLSAATVTTKNSPLWKTNPKQQLGYLQVKNWARAHTPGAILGVYTPDELEQIQPEKEINPARPPRQTGTQAGEAARAQSAVKCDPAEREALIEKLELIASEYGVEAYAEEWSKLSKDQRKAVGTPEHERLKKVAASIAATAETIDPTTGEVIGNE